MRKESARNNIVGQEVKKIFLARVERHFSDLALLSLLLDSLENSKDVTFSYLIHDSFGKDTDILLPS